MPVERFFRWTCTKCGVTAERPSYGLPEGWKWMPLGVFKVIHLCPACQATLNLKPEFRDKGGTEPLIL